MHPALHRTVESGRNVRFKEPATFDGLDWGYGVLLVHANRLARAIDRPFRSARLCTLLLLVGMLECSSSAVKCCQWLLIWPEYLVQSTQSVCISSRGPAHSAIESVIHSRLIVRLKRTFASHSPDPTERCRDHANSAPAACNYTRSN
jgi:hypothetical protein